MRITTLLHLVAVLVSIPTSAGWVVNSNNNRRKTAGATTATALHAKTTSYNNNQRRIFLESMKTSAAAAALFMAAPVYSANALVKGNAPPPKSSKSTSDKPKCTNVEECQTMAEQKEQEVISLAMEGPPPSVTKGGTRYRDMQDGEEGSTIVVQDGDDVKLFYKVLKLGKRSYDGLSGEGTVVFSRGYGLQDDEEIPGDRTFDTVVGNYQNIRALNDAVLGMKKNQVRRFAILPQRGWERPTRTCDGGPGGQGAGGDLKTDYVVVPTATMVATEACMDSTKIPFPTSYAQQRRMAQRFDQSLIMEVQVVDIVSGGGAPAS